MTRALDDMSADLPSIYKYPYWLLAPTLRLLERRLVRKFECIQTVVANSTFCSSIYKAWGCNVEYVIHPPLDCDMFKPLSHKPSEDYVLTYIGTYGKEESYH